MTIQIYSKEEIDFLVNENKQLWEVVRAAKLVYSATGHEQVQRHIRRLGSALAKLDRK